MAFDTITPACADVAVMDAEKADVAVIPKRAKVAIVGFASNTLHLVPWNNPEFEIWGLNQGYANFQRRGDRWFEMHLPEYTEDMRDPEYLAWLAKCPIPVYMLTRRESVPNSVRYPIEDVISCVGRDYFMSSPAYMLGLAALEGFKEVHVYGVNLAIGDEYFYEKPNCEWLIGLLQGRGVTVHIPTASSLLKQYARYGYTQQRSPNAMTKALLQGRIAEYAKQAQQKLHEYHLLEGAKREADALMQVAEGLDRGADIVFSSPMDPVKASS